MYNPRIGEAVSFYVRGTVMQANVVRISPKTVTMSNNWRVNPIFILDPSLPPFEALNAVTAQTTGTGSSFKVGEKVRITSAAGARWAGKEGIVMKKNPKTLKLNLATAENPYGGTVTVPPSMLESV